MLRTSATELHPLVRLREAWPARFGAAEAEAFFAPGRVNLLGAHLDYNEGFVLPMALDAGTFVLARPRADRRLRFASLDREPAVDLSLDDLAFDATHGWANYPKGVLRGLAAGNLPGLDLLFASNLPIGAGLSSSASILMSAAVAANRFLPQALSRAQLVRVCHEAESGYVGVLCGIMDPYVSAFGRRDHLLHLDCRRIEHTEVPLDSTRASIVVCDTSRRRENSDGRFNDRVRECADAVDRLRASGLEITALRDLTAERLEASRALLPENLLRRATHVVTEIERTSVGAGALRRGDLEEFGACLRRSHESCRDFYEVSSPELDAMVASAHRSPGTYGARLTGAGFGGCCVAVVRPDAVERFLFEVPRDFEKSTGLRARLRVFHPGEGAREWDRAEVGS